MEMAAGSVSRVLNRRAPRRARRRTARAARISVTLSDTLRGRCADAYQQLLTHRGLCPLKVLQHLDSYLRCDII
jgi:hypothetical protein